MAHYESCHQLFGLNDAQTNKKKIKKCVIHVNEIAMSQP